MPVGVLQPVYYPWLTIAFTAIGAGNTSTVLGKPDATNGQRPLKQWLKLERISVSYNPAATSGTPWTLEVYNKGALVIDEDFTRATTGWKTEERDIAVSVAATNAATPGYLTAKIVNPAGTGLTGPTVIIEGYLVDL